MGALGDYIHLTWRGYCQDRYNTGTDILYKNAAGVYNEIENRQNAIIKKYKDRVKQVDINNYQRNLNIYQGFFQRNEETDDKDAQTLSKAISEEFLKNVNDIFIEEYPHYVKLALTETYNVRKRSVKRTSSEIKSEIDDIKKMLLNARKTGGNRANTQNLLNSLSAELKRIQTMYNNLSKKRQAELADKAGLDFNTLLNNFSNLIQKMDAQQKTNGGIIDQAIVTLIRDFISGIKIEQLQKEINKNYENIKYKDVRNEVSKIPVEIDKTISISFPFLIQQLVNVVDKGVSIFRAKGDALEYMIAAAAEAGDPSEFAKKVSRKTIGDIISKQKISQNVVGTSGVSDSILYLDFIGGEYQEDIKNQKVFENKDKGGTVIVTSTDTQEKVDVKVEIGKNTFGISAKNYAFDKKGEQIVSPKMEKGITAVSSSPLLSFLQEDISKASKNNINMAAFTNHLLNLKIQHPDYINDEELISYRQSKQEQEMIPLVENYTKLLNKIIMVKSVIGEGMLRYKNSSVQEIQGAELFVLNNNQTGQIIVKSTAQIIESCINNNNNIGYSILYNGKYGDPLEDIGYLMSDFPNSNKRIVDIIMKLYNIKVTSKLNINFNNFAKL